MLKLKRKFTEEFANRIAELNDFLDSALETIEVVSTPEKIYDTERFIRDKKDRPILRLPTAIQSNTCCSIIPACPACLA